MNGSMEGSRRDSRLLRLAYRDARRKRDFGGMLKIAQAGDAMGLPVGRASNDAEISGVGANRYGMNAEKTRALTGQSPQAGGLDGFDFRHSSEGGPGVGGYDFGQRRNRGQLRAGMVPEPGTGSEPPLGEGEQWDSVYGRRAAANIDPGMTAPAAGRPVAMPEMGAGELAEFDRTATTATTAPGASVPALTLHQPKSRESFRQAWHGAQSQDEKDRIVEEAYAAGVPMNQSAIPSLHRRGIIGRGGATWSGLEAQRKYEAGEGPAPSQGTFIMAPDDPNRHPDAPKPQMFRRPDGSLRRSVVNEGPTDIPAGLAPTQAEVDAFQAERRAAAGQPALPAAQPPVAAAASRPLSAEDEAAVSQYMTANPRSYETGGEIAQRFGDRRNALRQKHAQINSDALASEAVDREKFDAETQRYYDARMGEARLRDYRLNDLRKGHIRSMEQERAAEAEADSGLTGLVNRAVDSGFSPRFSEPVPGRPFQYQKGEDPLVTAKRLEAIRRQRMTKR